MEKGRAKSVLKKAGVSGFNKPKRTPDHPKKSHIVVAKVGEKVKTIRFGQQGVSGSPKKQGESTSYRKRRESFKARHAKNIAKGIASARKEARYRAQSILSTWLKPFSGAFRPKWN